MKKEPGLSDTFEETDDDGAVRAFIKATVPYYKPNVYPVVLQKNVSVFGRFLGDSDAEKIQDQQNTLNRMEQKVIDRFVKAGTVITKPASTHMPLSSEDSGVWILENPQDKALIGVYDFKGDLQYELAYISQVYEESRRLLGITDSFQGRTDSTATSGKAKQFAAAQSAGRLESKRIMKNAAYARLFELIFKFRLAYCDEPRDVVSKDENGDTKYDTFSPLDFLEMDTAGQWHWIDDFIFSTDTAATLAGNREAMWQETTEHLQAGAFGDPAGLDTLVLYWTKMEGLHYPGAGQTKTYLQKKLEAQQQAALAQMQTPGAAGTGTGAPQAAQSGGALPQTEAAAQAAGQNADGGAMTRDQLVALQQLTQQGQI